MTEAEREGVISSETVAAWDLMEPCQSCEEHRLLPKTFLLFLISLSPITKVWESKAGGFASDNLLPSHQQRQKKVKRVEEGVAMGTEAPPGFWASLHKLQTATQSNKFQEDDSLMTRALQKTRV